MCSTIRPLVIAWVDTESDRSDGDGHLTEQTYDATELATEPAPSDVMKRSTPAPEGKFYSEREGILGSYTVAHRRKLAIDSQQPRSKNPASDTSTPLFVCNACGKKFLSTAQAEFHMRLKEHTDFSEVTSPISDAEKSALLEEVQQRHVAQEDHRLLLDANAPKNTRSGKQYGAGERDSHGAEKAQHREPLALHISALEGGGMAKSLVCMECGRILRNEIAAEFHASTT